MASFPNIITVMIKLRKTDKLTKRNIPAPPQKKILNQQLRNELLPLRAAEAHISEIQYVLH